MADTRTSLTVEGGVTADSSAGASRSLAGRPADGAGAEADSAIPGTGPGVGEARRTLPLNSRRLTAALLRQLAGGLGLPTTASSDDLRTLIEGKLTEAGRDPLHTQVVLREHERGTHMSLQDETGVFHEFDPPEADDPHGSELSDVEEEEEDSEAVVALRTEVDQLRRELETQKGKLREMWRLNCEQLAEMDTLLVEREEENTRLRGELTRLRGSSPSAHAMTSEGPRHSAEEEGMSDGRSRTRRGKAPPVDAFTGTDQECRLEDWLPTLKRAADWNGWRDSDLLLQLAGHLKGRALQEWNLLPDDQKTTYDRAVITLRERLDPCNRIMAAQDFRHAAQEGEEKVGDFIHRLEKLFRTAYGRDPISDETRSTLLYGQLQEGLKHLMMEAPAVSGATNYQALCIAAKAEERRLSELKKRRLYKLDQKLVRTGEARSDPRKGHQRTLQAPIDSQTKGGPSNQKQCWNCGRVGHIAAECRAPRQGGGNQTAGGRNNLARPTRTHQVQITRGARDYAASDEGNPRHFLLPDSDEEPVVRVTQVRVPDKGSRPQLVQVIVAGVPVQGVVDTAADITIVGAEAFKRIATVAKLRKRDLKPVDKTPRTYDEKTFHLDGRLDLDITFDGRTMKTPIYIKMDAKEQLLVSEGVCRQLGIVKYHKEVRPGDSTGGGNVQTEEVHVPSVRVLLAQTVKLRPEESVVAEVRLVGAGVGGDRLWYGGGVGPGPDPDEESTRLMLLESDRYQTVESGVLIFNALVEPSADGLTQALVTNPYSLTQRIVGGTDVGHAIPVDLVESEHVQLGQVGEGEPQINMVTGERGNDYSRERQKLLYDRLQELQNIPKNEREQLVTLLGRYHNVFSLVEGERGETDLTSIHISTGDATPKKHPVRRVPFAVRREVARQLAHMQEQGVIQPSSSPWASAIVLVRKKDGSLRICVDYRHLNSVTKSDTFPLPRIDDLLDQLGNSKYFTTLDLAAGYWQIRVADDSIEKTAFVTSNGLFEFRVMPFGLTNAPAVFQRLMQRVLSGLNKEEEPSFVVVYIDDILIFSRTMEEHLHHISLVLDRLQSAGLKLKASKCHFIRKQVEFLGHLITPRGLLPNPGKVSAVADFPVPSSVTQVRQFVGLASYYRRFIHNFAKLAGPLHRLTKKDVEFRWSNECQEAFDALKNKLVEAPVLVYPNFSMEFVLETDASYRGLGAVLSQRLEDHKLHPVAFASRALANPEKNYAVTELETLAVVWAIKHFRAYLYGHDVQVVTDHSAVKALLTVPSPSGKHARWWLQVFGSGLRQVDIVYRAGKQNVRADALSRNPTGSSQTEPLPIDTQVAAVRSDELSISDLLGVAPGEDSLGDFHLEQEKDSELQHLRQFLEYGILPAEEKEARKLAAQALSFVIVDNVLYFVDAKGRGRKRAAVPSHLQKTILDDHHGGKMAGHFSGARLYTSLSRLWWWRTMYKDAIEYSRGCGECATVTGVGRRWKPPLHPIPVQRPFQIIGVDIMELPVTTQGNRYVVVFQDFLTKWPLVFPTPDQKAIRIARLLAEEVVPMFGVPDSLLSDRGANLLAHVMQDVCQLLGVRKLNTTSYHPQCDGMVERLNRTLKTMLRKHVAKFGGQWDRFLPGILWAYRNTPHESTREKPSFLLFGLDLKSPTEAALLPPDPLSPTDLSSYREELVLSLSAARELAVANIQRAQEHYKGQYDRGTRVSELKVGDWVFVRFPEEETGKKRKLSRPWYGPFRVTVRKDPNLTVTKVYFPNDASITIHQLRVCRSPDQLPVGFYWYGAKRRSPGRVPNWLQKMFSSVEGRDTGEGAPKSAETAVRVQPGDGPNSLVLPSDPDVESSFGQSEDLGTISGDVDMGSREPLIAVEQEPVGQGVPDMVVPPSNSYSLRDRSQRRQPTRLMMTTSI